jgi:hypothetical protein
MRERRTWVEVRGVTGGQEGDISLYKLNGFFY